jgi:hypothetical protein
MATFFRICRKNYAFSSLTRALSVPLISYSWFVYPNSIWWNIQIMKPIITQNFAVSWHFLPHMSEYFNRRIVQVRGPVLHFILCWVVMRRIVSPPPNYQVEDHLWSAARGYLLSARAIQSSRAIFKDVVGRNHLKQKIKVKFLQI